MRHSITCDDGECLQADILSNSGYLGNLNLRIRALSQWPKHGKVTSRLVDQSRACPSVNTYNRRFGSLLNTYELLGYRSPHEIQITIRLRSMLIRAALIREVMKQFPDQFHKVRQSGGFRFILKHQETGLLLAVATANRFRTAGGKLRWLLRPPANERKRLTLVGLLNERNTSVSRLVIFQTMNFPGKSIQFSEDNEWLKTGRPLERLGQLLLVVNRLRCGSTPDERSG